MPDGETGPRSDWIVWQYPVFSSRPEFEVGPPGALSYRALPQLRLRDGEDAERLALRGPRLRRRGDGLLPRPSPASSATAWSRRHCRFQRLAADAARADQRVRAARVPGRARAGLRGAACCTSSSAILEAIPHDQLAIQWDARYEFAMLEGIAVWFEDVRAGVRRAPAAARRGWSPPAVELGFHLCYGDDEHGHFAVPHDAGKLVERRQRARRPALDRPAELDPHAGAARADDDGVLRAARRARLRRETELYLGLIHVDDGGVGARRRIAAAQQLPRATSASPPSAAGAAAAPPRSPGCSRCTASSARRSRRARTARRDAFAWPAGFVRVPDEDWTDARRRRGRPRLRQRRAARLVPQPRPHRRAARRTLRDGDILARLLRRHRHPARPAAPAGVRPPRRHRDRRRVAEVPARRAREVPRRRWSRCGCCASSRTRGGCSGSTRCSGPSSSSAASTPSRRPTPSTSTPTSTRRSASWVRALRPGGRVFINSGNIRNPRAEAQRVDPRRDGVGDQRPGRGHRAHRPAYVHYREPLDDDDRITAHAAHRDRVFLSRARSTSTWTR